MWAESKVKQRTSQWIRVTGIVVVCFFAVRILSRPPDAASIGPTALLFGLACAISNQLLSAVVWTFSVSGADDRRSDFIDYVLVQPAKYVPVGVFQYVGLYSRYIRRSQLRDLETFTIAAASTAYHAIIRPIPWVVAGTVFYSALIGAETSNQLVLTTLALTLLIAFGPRILRGYASSRTEKREKTFSKLLVAIQKATNVPVTNRMGWWILTGACVFTNGLGFAVLSNEVSSVSTYGMAVAIGLLAVPIPAGIGIREAAFVFLTVSNVTDELLHLLVLYRFIHIVAEIALSLIVMLAQFRQRLVSKDNKIDSDYSAER